VTLNGTAHGSASWPGRHNHTVDEVAPVLAGARLGLVEGLLLLLVVELQPTITTAAIAPTADAAVRRTDADRRLVSMQLVAR
jgi:hypothetical protein